MSKKFNSHGGSLREGAIESPFEARGETTVASACDGAPCNVCGPATPASWAITKLSNFSYCGCTACPPYPVGHPSPESGFIIDEPGDNHQPEIENLMMFQFVGINFNCLFAATFNMAQSLTGSHKVYPACTGGTPSGQAQFLIYLMFFQDGPDLKAALMVTNQPFAASSWCYRPNAWFYEEVVVEDCYSPILFENNDRSCGYEGIARMPLGTGPVMGIATGGSFLVTPCWEAEAGI